MKTVRNISAILGACALSLSIFASPALAASPVFTTYAASSITSTSAVLNGSYVSNASASTNVYFEYGTTSALGTTTTGVPMASSASSYSATITGLASNTTYFYRALGVNSTTGFAAGNIVSFTTTGNSLSSAITTSATNVTTSSATLNGSFTSGGAYTTYTSFEYANNPSFSGSTTTPQQSQNSSYGSFSDTIYNLQPNTTYYFRALANNVGGTAYGTPTLSFTTSTNGNGGTTSSCTVSNFYPTTSSVAYGASTSLYYSTNGCTNVSISGIGSVANGTNTVSTGALYSNPTNFTLTASDTYGTVYKYTSVSVGNGNTNNGNQNYGTCTITGFVAGNPSISSGGTTPLYYTTTGCSSVSISGGPVNSYYGTNGTATTGPLYGNTTFTLTAYGNNTDTRQVYVSVGNFLTNVWNNVFGQDTSNQVYYPTDSSYYPTTDTVTTAPIIQYVDGGTTGTSLALGSGSASLPGVEWGNHFPDGTTGVNNPNSVLGASVIGAGFLGMPLAGWVITLLIIIALVIIARMVINRRY